MTDSLSVDSAYSFFTAGHIYGSHRNSASIYPASSFLSFLLENVDEKQMFIGLGDIVRECRPVNFKVLKQATNSKETVFYNAPGNHDMADPEEYRRQTGPLNLHFEYRDDLFLIINTESFLKNDFKGVDEILNSVQNSDKNFRHVFILSHRVFWAGSKNELKFLDECVNEPYLKHTDTIRLKETVNSFSGIPHEGWTVFVAGDAGEEWSNSFFYRKYPSEKMIFSICGIADLESDIILEIRVEGNSKPVFLPHEIAVNRIADPEEFGIEFWKKEYEKKSETNEYSLFSMIKGLLSSKKFWAGFIISAILLSGIFFLYRSRLKK